MPDPEVLSLRWRRWFGSLRQMCCCAFGVFVLMGCSSQQSTQPVLAPSVAELLVEPAEVHMKAGGEAQLSAQANDAAGQPIAGARFRFAPADAKLLRISDRGLISSLGMVGARTPTQVIVACGSTETRVNVTIVPGEPVRMEKAGGDEQKVRAGERLSQPLSVRVLDTWGNPVAQVPVAIESNSTAIVGSEIISDAGGTVDFVPRPLTGVGSILINMQVKKAPMLTVPFEIHVLPGNPATIALLGAPPREGAEKSSTNIAFRVSDAFENQVPDVRLMVNSDAKEFAAVELRTDASGSAWFEPPKKLRLRRLTLNVALVDNPEVRQRFVIDQPRTVVR